MRPTNGPTAGEYDHYLHAAQNVDHFVERLWTTLQSIRQYRDKSTIIVTADHGRGPAAENWCSHGEKVDSSEGIFLAVIGPDTPPLGERQNHPPYSQSQIAGTIAALLGENIHTALPKAAEPIADLLSTSALKSK